MIYYKNFISMGDLIISIPRKLRYLGKVRLLVKDDEISFQLPENIANELNLQISDDIEINEEFFEGNEVLVIKSS